ncbi:MAG: 1,4-dihydroxy-2-naphthoate polyprenyltransferase [candidate division Zixibacteria bacterium]|jgi:1,4-dihydroxy-2-naphthoate octaprenyltransferase|nr:1,4-dihydroxy-2-naphthoate polyprenyltransferase [candidate division Zixibacteria bacterium]
MSSVSLSVWLLAARPKTLPAAVAPVFIGTVMAYVDGGFHLWAAVAALCGALLIQIGTNYANDYADFVKGTDTAERVGPVRITQAGLVSPTAVRNAAILIFGLAFLIGVYLVYRGGWPVVVIGLSSILFGALYTSGPSPLAYNGSADLFVLIFFGPVAVGGTYYVQTLAITESVLVAGLAPGLFSVAILTVNNLRDIDNDRVAGKRTLAVRFGRSFAFGEYVLAVSAACLVPVYLFAFGDGPVTVLAAVAVLPVALPSVSDMRHQKGSALNNTLAATGRLLLLYSALFCLGWMRWI